MDRNTALAFALSMLVFVMFLLYQQSRYEEAAREAELQAAAEEAIAPLASESGSAPAPAPTAAQPLDASAPAAMPARPVRRDVPLQKTTLKNENVIAEISNEAAMIERWSLRRYTERLPDGEIPIDLVGNGLPALRTELAGVAGADFSNVRFEVVETGPREVLQRAENAAGVLTRRIRLDERGYGFDLELGFESRRADPVDVRFELLWPAEISTTRPDFRELSLVAYVPDEGVEREAVVGIGKSGFLGFFGSPSGVVDIAGRPIWAGADVRYFAAVLIDPSERGGFDTRFEAVEAGEIAEARMALPSVAVGTGGSVRRTLRGFVGPKQAAELEAVGSGLEYSINRGYSWLEPLVRIFEIALDKLYALVPNYGVAIILLTIMVRILTTPLMVRQMRSAEKMRAAQPKLKALQEKYKDDRERQSQEMMKLFREEGVNPLGGCVPLLFQFPVLIGLFFALQSSIGLRHAPFVLWIDDLSQPATLFTLPGLDFPIRLLPLIMGGSMFVQQKMTPTTGMDPAQAKMMLIMMPAMMVLISYTFPSGLVLYWTVSNLLGIGHQYWIRKQMNPQT